MEDLLNFNWDTDPISEFVESNEDFLVDETKDTQKDDKTNEIKKTNDEEKDNEENIKKNSKDESDEELKDKSKNKLSDNDKEKEDDEELTDDAFIDKDDSDTEKEKSDDESLSDFKVLTKKLKDSGIITTDIDENDIEDENDFLTLQEKEIEKRVDDQLKQFSNELTEEGKLFIKYIKEGGNPKEFFDVLKDTTSIPQYNEDNESQNERVIEYYLKNIKDITDDEDIRDTIDVLKEKGTLDKYAKKYSDSLDKIKEKRENSILQKQKEINEINEQNKKKFETEIENFLDSNNEINGINISSKEKEVLKQYIFKPSKKLGKNYISKFSLDLQEAFKDPSKIVTLAKLLNNNFEMKDLINQIETKITKETKKKINNYSKPKTENKSLLDYF